MRSAQECLASHGIIIDENAKTLTIQSNSVNADMVYDLTDEELKKLTSNSIKEVPVVQRLELLNGIIKDDFADKILMDTLNSKERIDLHLHPELEQELQQRQHQPRNGCFRWKRTRLSDVTCCKAMPW